jgi:glycosyltransferase involved in cell wall biosynthesis
VGGICIESDNEVELMEVVQQLQADPELAARLGQAGHDFVAANFDRRKLALAYLEYLQEIVVK